MEKNKLGVKISAAGVTRIEIDESKIIGNAKKLFWLLGIIDQSTKECSVLYFIIEIRKLYYH